MKTTKSLSDLSLTDNERNALTELKRRLSDEFSGVEIILFGSAARDESEEFSDIDLLILLEEEPSTDIENQIIAIAYDLELKYDTVFGLLIESKHFWNSGLAGAMPIHRNIEREGIAI